VNQRLFFLRVDELTDLRTLDPTDLPTGMSPATAIVLEALRIETLSDGLCSWINELRATGDEYELTVGIDYSPKEWIESMATYLKSVLEFAFQEAFARPLVTTVSGSTKLVVDDEFKIAFEKFANGMLGDNGGVGVPTSNMGVPDGAYFFSFAAFAWIAKTKATTADERSFWRALWPVFAYTAEIYRQRYSPAPSGGQYGDYIYTQTKAALTDVEIAALRKTTMSKAAFRSILQASCSGC
jgi:hypothetical protein